MRKLIGGLLGLCLLAALVPVEASARTDARASAQSSSSRSASTRQAAARPSTTSSSRSAARTSDRGRATASRAATPSRHATAERSSRRGRDTASVSRSRGRDSYASARGNRGLNSRVAAAVPYGRYAALPQGRGLRRTAMASCSMRHGRRTCTTTASRSEVMRWTGGLAPAAMSQSACPDGTIATMAVGHNDITRCVPL
jgi:hypothetical protein